MAREEVKAITYEVKNTTTKTVVMFLVIIGCLAPCNYGSVRHVLCCQWSKALT